MTEKVIFLTNGLYGGGVQNAVRLLATELCQKFHVLVLTSVFDADKDILYDFDVVEFDFRETNSEKNNFFSNSVVFANTFDSYKFCSSLISLSIVESKKIFFVVHVDYYAMYYRWFYPVKNFIRSSRYRSLFDNRNLIFVSEGVKSSLIENIGIFPVKSHVLSPASDLELINKKAFEFSVNFDKSYIVIVARLIRRKRVDLAIELIKQLDSDIDLVILGDGDQKDALLNLSFKLKVADRVHFVGWKSNPYPYILHSRMLISTSEIEGFGLTIVEALSLGVPVVSTRAKSGPEEILNEIAPECLVNVNDINQLTSVVRRELSIPLTQEKKKRLVRYAQKYDLKNIGFEYARLIKDAQ